MRAHNWIPKLVALGLVLGLGGCPAAEESGTTLDVSSPATDTPIAEDAAPDTTGELDTGVPDTGLPAPELAPDLEAALEALIDEYPHMSGEPGISIALRTGDGATWQGASGVADRSTGTALSTTSVYRTGSNTKPFVATVILQLAEDGLVSIDDTLADHLPDYPKWAEITIRDLLGMRSGIPEYLTRVSLFTEIALDPEASHAPAELLAHVADDDLDFEPGKSCSYSNTNYVLLGLIIEAVTGKSAAEVIDERIATPLGLSRTWLDMGGDSLSDLAHGYIDIDVIGPVYGVPSLFVGALPAEAFVDDMMIDATLLFHPSIAWTAGSIVSNPTDAVTFMRALLRGDLLGQESLDQMTDVRTCELLGGTVDYGLGLMRYPTAYGDAWGHGGLNFGYEVANYYFPKQDTSLCRMHHQLPEEGVPLHETLLRLVFDGPPGLPNAPCIPPEGLEAGIEEPYMRVSYRGVISAEGDPQQPTGITFAEARIGGKRLPLSAWPIPANLTANPLGARIDLRPSATTIVDGIDLRTGILSFEPALLQATNADGIATPSGLNPYEVVATVAETRFVPGTVQPSRICSVAATDAARPSRIYVCAPGSQKGDPIAIHAVISLTADAAAVEAYIKPFLPAQCVCPDEKGAWLACP